MSTTTTTAIARTTCKYPGCGEPAAPAAGTGRPPEYCAGRGHTRVSLPRLRNVMTVVIRSQVPPQGVARQVRPARQPAAGPPLSTVCR
jgi:hypothetical protein